MAGEEEWTPVLEHLPLWQPRIGHALIVSPHPDDETLGAGGLILKLRAQGARVTVVAVTDGENAYPDEPGQGVVREREQTAALDRLGVAPSDIVRLRLPDSAVTSHESELARELCLLAVPGVHLFAPWRGDFHPDHEACGRASACVAERLGLPLISYFFWTWHRGLPETIAGLNLVRLPLTGEEIAARRVALNCHRSQLEHGSGQPILPAYLLGPLQRPYEVFAL